MPQMADITVKASNGTTDVVFTALSPAGQDGTYAVWRVEDANPPSQRTLFELRTSWNGPKTARRSEAKFTRPLLQATAVAGVNNVIGNIVVDGNVMTVPQVASTSNVQEAAAQYANLMKSTLVQQCLIAGFAPN
jgi:hypothetical protein